MSPSRQTILHPRRPRRTLLAALAVGVTIAACGSSGGPGTSNHFAQALKFSECMRSHGVPDFPDPKSAGGGIQIQLNSGINPFSPAFKAAQTACRKLMPGGGPGNGPPSAQARAQMLAISTCMRAHGVTEFPDPTTSPPSNPGAQGAVLGRDGVFLAIPSTINIGSPAFKRAAAACHFGPP